MNSKRMLAAQKQKVVRFITKDPLFAFNVFVVVLLAIIFRVYNYFDRIYVYADNALFVETAYYAFVNRIIPQIGTFAQGPFFTGPWWLWILALTYIVPLGMFTPWYAMTVLSFVFIVLLYKIGKEIGGKTVGLLAAFFGAISPAQIDNSFMTWNAAADPFLALLALFFFVRFRKNPKPVTLFFLGFVTSLATTIHFQAFFISALIPLALFTTKPRLKNIIALIIGGCIPLLPFLYFDLRFNWFETRRIMDYMLIGQYRIYVPNRWLTYAGVFWPQSWAWIIGGSTWMGYVLMSVVGLAHVLGILKFKKYVSYYLIVTAFLISVILLRYYRGERFFYFTNYAHGFVLLITAWTVGWVYKIKKIMGILLITLITVFSVQVAIANFAPRVITMADVNVLASEIYSRYPQEATFDVYECPFQASLVSTPLAYKMYFDGRSPGGGIKIGVCNQNLDLTWRQLRDDEVDKPYTYQNKSTPQTYKSITEWWIENPPLTLW